MNRKQGVWRAAAATALALGVGLAHAQSASAVQAPPASTEDALHAMLDAAGIVFAGAVTAIRHPRLADGSPGGVVEVDFAVSEAMRGVRGSSYTLREWAGLWAANDQPLRIGQRYLMLLHAPNAAGLSSPVGGADGAIPIRGIGRAATPDGIAPTTGGASVLAVNASVGAGTSAPAEVVDLGWVATHAAVPLVYAEAHGVTASPILVHASARTTAAAESTGGGRDLRAGTPGRVPDNIQDDVHDNRADDARVSSYGAVVRSLRTWEASHVASR